MEAFFAPISKENGYDGTDLSPKEQYYKHADGRDDGLNEIDGDSPEASFLHTAPAFFLMRK